MWEEELGIGEAKTMDQVRKRRPRIWQLVSILQLAFHAYKYPGELVKMQIFSQFCISTQLPEDSQAYLG